MTTSRSPDRHFSALTGTTQFVALIHCKLILLICMQGHGQSGFEVQRNGAPPSVVITSDARPRRVSHCPFAQVGLQ